MSNIQSKTMLMGTEQYQNIRIKIMKRPMNGKMFCSKIGSRLFSSIKSVCSNVSRTFNSRHGRINLTIPRPCRAVSEQRSDVLGPTYLPTYTTRHLYLVPTYYLINIGHLYLVRII